MKRILVVNVNWLGDVIFSSPVFKALKTAYPHATVVCLAVPRVKEILESIPEIDQIISYDEDGKHKGLIGKLKLINEIRSKQFDIAFLLHRSMTRAFLVFSAGIPLRVGYDAKNRGFLLTHKVEPLAGNVHRSDIYLQVIESFGIKIPDRICDLKVKPQELKDIDVFLKRKGISAQDFLVLVNPGGNWDLKRWSPESFGLLVRCLMKDCNIKVIISGSQKDVDLANTIALISQTDPIILAGETKIQRLLALMQRSHLVISADSGPLHLANSVATAVIGLFGPTRPEITGPRGKGEVRIIQKDVGCNRAPCYFLNCPRNICMESIKVEDVVMEVRKFQTNRSTIRSSV